MLGLIKLTHTIIWAIMAAATIYILYAGITGVTSIWLWFALGLMIFEVLVLLVYKMECPLTAVAKKYSKENKSGMDIYLPYWFARFNKVIFGTMLFIGIALIIIRAVF